MITEWFIDLGSTLLTWIIGFFGTEDPADWFTDVGTFVSGLLTSVAGLGAWVPWAIAITVWITLTTIWLVGLTIRVMRWLLGLIPTMGGS